MMDGFTLANRLSSMSICSTLISFHGVLVQSSILDCHRAKNEREERTKQLRCFYEDMTQRSSGWLRNVNLIKILISSCVP